MVTQEKKKRRKEGGDPDDCTRPVCRVIKGNTERIEREHEEALPGPEYDEELRIVT